MSSPRPQPLARTPSLERLLERLGGGLTRQIWLFGIGTLLACTVAWIAFAFVADYALRVPHGVRLFHMLVTFAVPALCAWHFLWKPLRRRPDRARTAVLLERAKPGTHDLFVSAVQLQERPAAEAAPALVDELMESAEAAARTTALEGVLDERPARRRAALGGGSVAAVAVLALLFPELARTFAARLFNASVHWPQRTYLSLEIPLSADKAAVTEQDGVRVVRVARGTDVPVLVRAEGSAPDEVRLEFSSTEPLVVARSSDGTYRTLLRSLQEDLEVRASGGDDDGARARARIEVLSPPDLAGLALRLEPPAYTGRAPSVEFDRDVEVLAGTRIVAVILTEPEDARARARILPADRVEELAAMAFPARREGEPELQGRGFELLASESLRLRFELEDANGLKNPDPGLFAVRVVADEKPQVGVQAPSRSEVDTLVSGWIPLRARASDDFGITAMQWSLRPGADEAPSAPRELPWRVLEPSEREADEVRAVIAVGSARLEVAALGDPARPVVEGAQYVLEVLARDNRPDGGEAGLSRSAPIHVRVVSAEEFLRRVQDRLARVRSSVGELETLSLEKGARARELVASLESDAPERGAGAGELAALYAGARRVEGDAQAIARELCSIAEAVLYARLDSEADGTLIALDEALAQAPRSGGFPWEAWQEFGRSADAGRSRASLAGQLAGLVELALKIDLEDARGAAKAAERAAQATDIAEVHEALGEQVRLGAQMDQDIQQLLYRLSEWDNFQSILSLTKDILNRQKALRESVKSAVGGK